MLIIGFSMCSNDKLTELALQWSSKSIIFPHTMCFTSHVADTIDFDYKSNLKVLYYVDSTGCSSCKLNLGAWKSFIDTVSMYFNNRCRFIINFTPKNKNFIYDELRTKFKTTGFDYPVCIDITDSLNILNNFPKDIRFHCFLLDENNKVILIGNPIHNSKIKELYLSTISERLGIDYHLSYSLASSPEINLGSFSQSKSKTAEFLVPNNSKSIIQIDSVFTSCECTTATIDKTVINPSEFANLTVKYTPDGVGDFYREVYVQIKGDDKPLVYIIRGKIEEN